MIHTIVACIGLASCGVSWAIEPTPPLVVAAAATAADSLAGVSALNEAAQAVPSVAASAAPPDNSAVPRRDIFDVLNEHVLHRRVEPGVEGTSSGIAWSILPTVNYNSVYGLAGGLSVSAAGTLGNEPGSRPSALSISANYSTTHQVQIQVRGDGFSPSGKYLVKGDVRYLDTARSTWGIGPLTPEQQEYPMQFRLFRLYG